VVWLYPQARALALMTDLDSMLYMHVPLLGPHRLGGIFDPLYYYFQIMILIKITPHYHNLKIIINTSRKSFKEVPRGSEISGIFDPLYYYFQIMILIKNTPIIII